MTGNLYVVDPVNHTIRRVTPGGMVTTFAGLAGVNGSGGGGDRCVVRARPARARHEAGSQSFLANSGFRGLNGRTGQRADRQPEIYPPPAMQSTALPPLRLLTGLLFTIAFTTAATAQSNYATPYYFSTFAGIPGGPGDADGPGPEARFKSPKAVAVDLSGNVYVADSDNHMIRKISPAGEVTTLAGSPELVGTSDGSGSNARFNSPQGIACDLAGNLYVADTRNHTIRKISSSGIVTTLAGSADSAGYADGTGSAARFSQPAGLALDSAGNLYVADLDMHNIRKISPAGLVTTLAGSAVDLTGNVDGTGTAARFGVPSGLAADNAGNLYVADSYNNNVRKISPTGTVTTVVSNGSAATFNNPQGIAVDSLGNIFVTSGTVIDKISPSGAITIQAGSTTDYGKADGIGTNAFFNQHPEGLAVDSNGIVYVADTRSHTVRKITPTGVVTTLAGSAGSDGNSVDGPAIDALFNRPDGVALDGNGNIYVADTTNDTIRKITASGVVTTLAGSVSAWGGTDGTGSAARFDVPGGIAADKSGNVFVADTGSFTIRKITPAGVVTTLAGMAREGGNTDGTGSAARFALPHSVAVEDNGNIFVADTGNHTIRKITSSGLVTTLAGFPGQKGSTDGVGSAALFYLPQGVALDGAGNVYVADTYNQTIRKITPAGLVTTLAGTAGLSGGDDGTGPAAHFDNPAGIAVDNHGNVFVADHNSTIRKITPAGVVTTLAGLRDRHGNQNGIGSTARFSSPGGIAVDQAGVLYVANTFSHNIRKGQLAGPPVISTQPLSQAVSVGSNVQLSVTAGSVPAPTYQWYFNGSAFSGATSGTLSLANARSTDAGDYTVVVTNSLGSVTSDKATLTVGPATPTAPSASSSGGGGGGSINSWFALALVALGVTRKFLGDRC